MNILAIDTSSEVLSVSLNVDHCVYISVVQAGTSHSSLLFDLIDSTVNDAHTQRTSIDLFACMGGPGSFTGLRIGFAAVKGLALALGKQFASVPTLDCIAEAHNEFNGIVLPLLDAKQNRFFCRCYKSGEAVSPLLDAGVETIAGLLPPEEPVLLTGPAAAKAMRQLSDLAEKAAFNGIAWLTTAKNAVRPYSLDLLNYIENDTTLKNGDDIFSAPIYVRPAV